MSNVEPRANPPIIVGELTDVPAPGSPIASPWAQEVSNRITHRFANKAALDGWAAANGSVAWTSDNGLTWVRVGGVWRVQPGTVIASAGFFSGGLTYTTGGQRDILSMPLGVMPAPCNVFVNVVVHFGFAGGPVNAGTDIWGIQANAVVASGGSPIQAPTGAFITSPQLAMLSLTAGQTADTKARIGITALTGTVYVYAWGTVQAVAT